MMSPELLTGLTSTIATVVVPLIIQALKAIPKVPVEEGQSLRPRVINASLSLIVAGIAAWQTGVYEEDGTIRDAVVTLVSAAITFFGSHFLYKGARAVTNT